MAAQVEAKKIDVLAHNLVPKHTILSPEEIEAILSELNVSMAQLPILSSTDPVAKAIGAKPGNVVKIERIGPGGKTAYYRQVA